MVARSYFVIDTFQSEVKIAEDMYPKETTADLSDHREINSIIILNFYSSYA